MNFSRVIKGDELINARDLGGLKTEDGRTVAPKRLIRTSALTNITEKDAWILSKIYRVHTIVDMRMEQEIDEAPDKQIEGVNTVFIPLLDSSFLGIARDEYSIDAWLNVYKNSDADPKEIFREMYLKIAFSERNKEYFRKFFDVLLSNESGAVLWHCSAGKDRVGISTAILLRALGVSRKNVVEDYYLTEILTKDILMKYALLSPLKGYTGRLHRAIVILFSAKREFIEWVLDEIDTRYGSVEKYLNDYAGVTPEEIEKLRQMYLR